MAPAPPLRDRDRAIGLARAFLYPPARIAAMVAAACAVADDHPTAADLMLADATAMTGSLAPAERCEALLALARAPARIGVNADQPAALLAAAERHAWAAWGRDGTTGPL